jgi:hypothetical protein
MKGFRSLLLFSVLGIVYGCNQGSDTGLNGGGSSGNWTIPRAGTMYVFRMTSSSLADSAKLDTLLVLGSHEQAGGKSNVSRFADLSESDSKPAIFISYESNGDISFGGPFNDTASSFRWTTYPTGSHKTISDPKVDTFEFSSHIVESGDRSYVGTETITAAGRNYSTSHVRVTSRFLDVDTSGSFADSSNTTLDYWFAPSIGFIAKGMQHGSSSGSPDRDEIIELVGYIPK